MRLNPLIPGIPSSPVSWYNRDLQSEELLAYELGWRAQPTERFSWDLALFYNVYNRLITGQLLLPATFPPEFRLENGMSGQTYGTELACQWKVTPRWQLRGHYALLQMYLRADPSAGGGYDETAGVSPHNQVYFQSSWDLNYNLEFDLVARYVDELPALGVPSYIAMDLRFAWRPREDFELAVIGQNLLENHRSEFIDNLGHFQNTEVQRGVFANVIWRY